LKIGIERNNITKGKIKPRLLKRNIRIHKSVQ
jgi:hypothetical protein